MRHILNQLDESICLEGLLLAAALAPVMTAPSTVAAAPRVDLNV